MSFWRIVDWPLRALSWLLIQGYRYSL